MGNFKNLSNICLSSLSNIFLDDLEIAKVTSVFKAGNNTELNNYRPIFVLICFSKILERVIYNRLYKYRLDSNIIYKKHFGFYEGQSTDHEILQLLDQIHNNFEQNNFTLGVFMDTSKASLQHTT